MTDKKKKNGAVPLEETEVSGTEEQTQGIAINAQYIKDLSFENPNPIENLVNQETTSSSTVNIEVSGQHLTEQSFEVSLKIKAKVEQSQKSVYLIELDYAGVFTLSGFPDDVMRLILFVECPRLLFPFARAIVSRVTQESGFPPLFLKPVDFAELLRQRLEEEAEQGTTKAQQKH
ncbi:MAG: protein-export chaperone SecB [Alphaproteobacteria bacterium]